MANGWYRIASALAAVVVAGASGLAGAQGLTPHRALYALKLDESEPAANVRAVKGGLAVEWRGTCAGWASRQRLGFVAETEQGPGFTFDARFSSFETLNARDLTFEVENYEGLDLESAYQGEAHLGSAGAGGEARFAEPEARTVVLPPGTLFPAAHLERLIAAAAKGEAVLSEPVFDGSGFDALTQISAAIGEPLVEGGETWWPVSMAFHRADQPNEAVPDFELGGELAGNGAMRAIRLDYGDFALQGELTRLDLLPKPDC